ncbi:F-BAR and double SH3 domains protein 1-like [Ruditapes philippinarum]|uniref:F-BAR and double SH3 domains protein 1-like n=1 Tax=Ruditapes philippinarum TaxID=129788 RepID=UPI00295BB428|nr:F-BAR and double SH3 domains protein 1-like [Ruditapes philippinarum]
MKCRSIYDFHAGNADELDMAENEELEIIANGDGDGWVRAKNSAGLIGFIPENYIVFVDENNSAVQHEDVVDTQYTEGEAHTSMEEPEISSPPPPMTPVTPTSPTSIPTIEEPEECNFPPPPPDTQEVTSYSSGDIEVQQTTSSMENMHLPLDDACYVRALYDYEGTSQEELCFAEGTIIRIIRKDENGIDDGFWEGEVNGVVGVFPSLVVEELSTAGTAHDFPSPLQSPPDYMPPPPVMITAATPESEHPPLSPLTPTTPIANGTVHAQTEENESTSLEQHRKKVRFGKKNYYNGYHGNRYNSEAFYNQHDMIVDEYDSRFDDDAEESFV